MDEIKKCIDEIIELREKELAVRERLDEFHVWFAEGYEDREIHIANRLFEVAEALGVDPKYDSTTVIRGYVNKRYHFEYRGYKLFGYVRVARLEDL